MKSPMVRAYSLMSFATVIAFLFFTSCARHQDLVEVTTTIPRDIRYATTNNFTHQKLYDTARCMLRPDAAKKLEAVQADAQQMGLSLKVYDCYRPLSVQKRMWAIVHDDRYVADPAKGSRHNRGAAVDLTLIDKNGAELTMPTPYDDFTEKAHRDYS